ncbi:MAG: flagellin, partial [Caulobacter sp.]|nr:flagellin [Caulobacter sp.]
MAMNSINTNVGAMVALQNLATTSTALQSTQAHISTGKKITSAKDNGAIWSIAQGQASASSALESTKVSLQRAQSVLDTTLAAGDTIKDLLTQMKQKALSASDANIDAATVKKYQDEFNSLAGTIDNVVKAATFDGTNIIDTTAAGYKDIAAIGDATGATVIGVAKADLSSTTLGVPSNTTAWTQDTIVAGPPITTTAGTARTASDAVDTALTTLTTTLSAMGVGSKAIDSQLSFVGKLQDSLDAGVGNLVDADMAKESAKLQSLQTKQQLGVQALSIANSS